MNIVDFLKESIGEREYFHFTGYPELIKILKSNTLEGYYYETSNSKNKEICVLRPSMASNKNIESIGSNTDGGVKIIINASILSDKERGVKFSKIAEFPLKYKKIIQNRIGKNINFNSFIKELKDNIKKTNLKVNRANVTKINNKMEHLWNKYELNEDQFLMIINFYVRYIQEVKHREGEERIQLKKGIELNPKYIKIELKNSSRIFNDLDSFDRKNIISLIKEKKNLFIHNKIYNDLIKGKFNEVKA